MINSYFVTYSFLYAHVFGIALTKINGLVVHTEEAINFNDLDSGYICSVF